VIVVDTSIWVEAHGRPTGATANCLRSLLDADQVALAAPVRLELFAGVSRRDQSALARALSALPLLQPSDDTWRLVERWVSTGADRGQRFALSDLLIAALAAEIGGLIWSLDEDFKRLEQLKLIERYEV
jgi:predicted nucleic acid-binding protein